MATKINGIRLPPGSCGVVGDCLLRDLYGHSLTGRIYVAGHISMMVSKAA
jgi:hypothetical protein